MKVSDLIKELSDYSPNAEVFIWFDKEHNFRVAELVEWNISWNQVRISDGK